MLRRNLLKTLFFSTALLCTIKASALDLLDAYQLGLQSDPTYQAAVATYLKQKELSPQAWSAALPQIIGNANATSVLYNGAYSNLYSQLNPYDVGVNLSQVVFDWGIFNRIREAKSSVKQAIYTLAAAKQDLMIRVSRAYFDVLLAQDNLRYTQQQCKGALEQVHATQERLKVGHATITSLEQFQAQYQLLRSQVYSSKIILSNREEALGEIIGRGFGTLVPLKKQFVSTGPNPANLSLWLQKAGINNLSLDAARYGVIAAKKNIQATLGGYFPTLNVTASYDTDNSPAVVEIGQTVSNVGLNLAFPVFQGGATNSAMREARATFELATAEFDQAYRLALSETKQAYSALLFGVVQLSAARSNVASNESALAHVKEGYTAGIQTTLDVVQQQTRLLEAQRAYAQERYAYLTNILLIEQGVGTLKPENLAILQRQSFLSVTPHNPS